MGTSARIRIWIRICWIRNIYGIQIRKNMRFSTDPGPKGKTPTWKPTKNLLFAQNIFLNNLLMSEKIFRKCSWPGFGSIFLQGGSRSIFFRADPDPHSMISWFSSCWKNYLLYNNINDTSDIVRFLFHSVMGHSVEYLEKC